MMYCTIYTNCAYLYNIKKAGGVSTPAMRKENSSHDDSWVGKGESTKALTY